MLERLNTLALPPDLPYSPVKSFNQLPMNTTASRPWQGTTLGVFGILRVICLFLGAILLFFAQGFLSGLLDMPEAANVTAEGKAAAAGMIGIISRFAAII